MSHLEEKLLEVASPRGLLLAGIGVAAVGVLPLLLYIAFGPADGNPIGLGLLAVAAVPLAALLCLLTAVKWLVIAFSPRKR